MCHVLTLFAADTLTPEVVAPLHAALRTDGVRLAEPDWLAPGTACDLAFDHPRPAAVETLVRRLLGRRPIDLAVQAAAGRRKRLLLADMESTVIENEMLDELAELAGVGPQVAAITARAMNGEIEFEDAVRRRVGLLAGLSTESLERAWEKVEVIPGARSLLATLRRHGVFTALVSGGFDFFAERVRVGLGFDLQQSNLLLFADGRLSGDLGRPFHGHDAKLVLLRRLCAERGLTAGEVVAVGDGANDLPMLRAAGLGVAFRGKPRVAREARFRVDHGDLRALLYFQGYRGEEIETGG